MKMRELILAKKAGLSHQQQEIRSLIQGLSSNGKEKVEDYQLAAWLMAVCWRGMSLDETAWLTDAMARSGDVLDLSSVSHIVGDKHSTGGVGDKTTLVFVPLLSACGLPMAKLSGRGLGHTGGTLDKLEAIPGFDTHLSVTEFIQQVKDIGAAIGGQTQDLAPADGRMYALRDATGTVESIPLIAASVMSKKIAAGANLIVLDVKCGSGAFMKTQEAAVELATTMAEVGKRLGKPVDSVVTDMEQPLGNAVGHTLEVEEAIAMLKGEGPADLQELCYTLGSLGLVSAGLVQNDEDARQKLKKAIESGAALAQLARIIERQHGDPRVLEKPVLMPQAKVKMEVFAPVEKKVWIKNLDGMVVADACALMGASRAKKGDPINHAVGVVLHAKVGHALEAGLPLATVYADDQDHARSAAKRLLEAFVFSEVPVPTPAVIKAAVR